MSFFDRVYNLTRGVIKTGLGGDEARADVALEEELRSVRSETRRREPVVKKPAPPASGDPPTPAADQPPEPPSFNPDGSRKRSL